MVKILWDHTANHTLLIRGDGRFLSFFLISHSGTTTSTNAGVTPHDFGWLGVVVWTCENMLYPMANYL